MKAKKIITEFSCTLLSFKYFNFLRKREDAMPTSVPTRKEKKKRFIKLPNIMIGVREVNSINE